MNKLLHAIALTSFSASIGLAASARADDSAIIKSAEFAAPADVAAKATIVEMSGGKMRTVREGKNAFTCMPDNSNSPGNDPMCLDKNAMAWAMARGAKKDPPQGKVGLCTCFRAVGREQHRSLCQEAGKRSRLAQDGSPHHGGWRDRSGRIPCNGQARHVLALYYVAGHPICASDGADALNRFFKLASGARAPLIKYDRFAHEAHGEPYLGNYRQAPMSGRAAGLRAHCTVASAPRSNAGKSSARILRDAYCLIFRLAGSAS